MATKTQVRNRAAGLLGRRTLGQAITNTIKTLLDLSYANVYADLKDEQLTFWSSATNTVIPDGVAPHVAALMALDATDQISVSDARMARILTKVSIAKPSIRRISNPIYESLDEAEDF